jgi:hypothetical protein
VSLERGVGKKRAGSRIVVRNPKIEKFTKIENFTDVNFKKSNFSENYDLLP